jgi:predicted RNA binding protein YcfA (HicA-like mRNA interferase family)
MEKLPVISGEKAAKAFVKAGWKVDRQTGAILFW